MHSSMFNVLQNAMSYPLIIHTFEPYFDLHERRVMFKFSNLIFLSPWKTVTKGKTHSIGHLSYADY